MKWLVDLVIATIGVPPCYYDRGLFNGDDFSQADLIADGSWRDLDLSSIIPVGTKAVHLHVRGADAIVGKILHICPSGIDTIAGHCSLRNQVANINIVNHRVVGVSADRKIAYKMPPPIWDVLVIGVKGWWK